MKHKDMTRAVLSGLSVAALLASAACQSQAPPDAAPAAASHAQLVSAGGRAPLPLMVSYRVLMTGMIGEAGFGLFRYSRTEAPPTEKAWQEAGLKATNLVAVATLLSLEGSNKKDKDLYRNPVWHAMARDFQLASADVATAASRRELGEFQKALVTLGDSCQACHAEFMDYQPRIMPDLALLR